MKKYIKKALWIIPFVFSLNLSATTYYFVGHLGTTASYNGSSLSNWNSTSTATPGSATGTPSNFTSTNDIFDLQGQQITFTGSNSLGEVKFESSTSGARLTGNSGTTITVSSTNPPIFDATNVTYDFYTNSTTFTYTSIANTTSISPLIYRNIRLYSGEKFVNGNVEIRGTLTMTAGTSIGTFLRIQSTTTLESSSSVVYRQNNTTTSASTSSQLGNGNCEIEIGANLIDKRGSKTFSVPVSVFYTNYGIQGTFLDLNINTDVYAAGDINISRNLSLIYSPSDPSVPVAAVTSILDVNGKTITLTGTSSTFNTSYDQADDSYSRMDLTATGSTLVLENNNTLLDPEYFGDLPFSTSVNQDIYALKLNSSQIHTFTGNYNFTNTLMVGSSAQAELSDATITIDGGALKLTSSSTSPITKVTNTTNKIYLNNGTLQINQSASSSSIPSGIIDNQAIKYLTVAFATAGTFTLTENYSIQNDIDLSANGSKLSLNGFSIDINGFITNTNGLSGGKFVGHVNSSLRCSTVNASVGTIYFDQTSTTNYTLQNLNLVNGATCNLGSNLIIANAINLGTGTLTVGSNTLTFTGSTATWITRNGGRINTTGGTIKYGHTSTAGTNHSIELAAYTSTTGNLNNLIIDFANACTFTPPSNMTIDGTLNLNGTNNTFDLNGTTLTVSGSVTSTGGKFKGSSSSNLYCSGTSALYFDQTSASTKSLKNLKIQGNNANVTLANALNIVGGSSYGSVEVTAASSTLTTGNNLTLKSDANGTARIANSPGTISGNYYAEQYFPANREFRFICAPVVGATALQWRNNGSTSSHTGLGISITGANPSTNSFDASTANKPSAFWYDETIAGSVTNVNSTGTDDPGWTSIANGNSYGLTNGKGFRVLVRGDRDISLTSSSPTPSTTTITSYGSYPRTSGSSVVLSVTNTNRTSETNNGLNLIGNPFPSTIDWNAISLSNVDNGYATYDPVGHKYKAWNGSLGDATQYISSGQAFFVMCTSNGIGSLTIEESDKFDGKGGNFFLEKLTNHMRINLMYDSVYNSDAFLHFRSDAKNVKDEWDIQQYYVNGTNIGTLDSNGKSYKINSLAAIDSFESIPLSVAKTPEAQLKLSFYDVVSFEGYKIELVDTYLKSTMPVTEGSIYTFDITADSNSVKDGRFFLNFTRIASASNKIIQATKIASIHPNPVADNLNISLIKEGQPTQFEIFNVTGQLITKGTTNSKSTAVNTKDYASGTYYIVLKTNNSSQTIQFVK